MSAYRPYFDKLELALSSGPYLYLRADIPVYAVEVTHRDDVDPDLLQRALDRTIARMPYLANTLQIEGGAVYFAKDPLPMEVGHTPWLRRVGGHETNYHMLDLTYDGNVTRFAMFHGFCDGQGLNAFVESVLYHYYCMLDGTTYDPHGIRSDASTMSAAEELDPYATTYEVDQQLQMPEAGEQVTPYHLPEIVPPTDDAIRDYGLRVDAERLMSLVKETGSSPVVTVSLIVGEAIAAAHPDADAPLVVIVPVSVRPMLGCEETFKNCSSRAMLPVGGTSLDALPFAERSAELRALLKRQLDPDLNRARTNMVGAKYRQRMEEATDYWEEVAKPAALSTISHDTFYVDYIGRLHKTDYADRLVDVRFLCKPAAGRTLHLNMIEHNGQFLIDCLACCDVEPLDDALAQAFAAHGLPVELGPVRRFSLPASAWREGIER